MDIAYILFRSFFAFGDIALIILLLSNLSGKKLTTFLKEIEISKIVAIFILTAAYYAIGKATLSPVIYNFINPFLILALMVFFVKKSRTFFSIKDIVSIWIIFMALIHLIMIPPLFILTYILEDQKAIVCILYILSLPASFYIALKTDLRRLFTFILRRNSLKFLIILSAIIFFTTSIITSSVRELRDYRVLLISFIIALIIGLLYVIKTTHINTSIIPEAYHDSKKLLMLLDIKTEKLTDIHELKTILNESITLMDLKMAKSVAVDCSKESQRFVAFIKNSVNSIKCDKKFSAEVVTNIQFKEKYEAINDITFGYITLLLLEHAFTKITRQPVFIDITSSTNCASIRVACEYRFEKSIAYFEKILLNKVDNTSSNTSRDFHLIKLKTLLDLLGGKAIITKERNIQQKADYLCICLVFKKEGVTSV